MCVRRMCRCSMHARARVDVAVTFRVLHALQSLAECCPIRVKSCQAISMCFTSCLIRAILPSPQEAWGVIAAAEARNGHAAASAQQLLCCGGVRAAFWLDAAGDFRQYCSPADGISECWGRHVGIGSSCILMESWKSLGQTCARHGGYCADTEGGSRGQGFGCAVV
jgi:hypothetical protein